MKRATLYLVALGSAALAVAGPTATWTTQTYAQFSEGDASFAFVTSLGEVRPGWATERVAVDSDGVWAALARSDGSILLGTDNKGAIVRVTGATTKTVASVKGAAAVVALAAAGNDVVVGAMPSNTLWRLNPSGALSAVTQLTGAETIWALAVSGDGTTYAGSGPDGTLWAIKGASAKVVFRTEDKRVSAISLAPDGAVWFGTGERALVFRYDPKNGQTRAMADIAGNEVTAIAATAAGAVIAANDIEAPSTPAKSATQVDAADKPKAPKGEEPKAPSKGTVPGTDDEKNLDGERKGARKGKGAVFRVGNDGRLEQLHALTSTYFTSVAVAPDGVVYAGAADKGRVYWMQDKTVATAFDVDERAVSKLFWLGPNLGFTTDDGAALYRATRRADNAKFVSEVYDAKSSSTFGRASWLASGKVSIETRSGNTAKPGPGWSDWAALRDGGTLPSGLATAKVASPAGRYVQFRAALGNADASLRQVTLYYAAQNQGVTLSDITVEPSSKEPLTTLKDLATKPRSPMMKVKWKAENPDGDEVEYRLSVRKEGDPMWRPLRIEKAPLTATSFEWNTETFGDGLYRIRVSATDALANSLDRAMTTEATSTVFAIDNERPTVTLTKPNSGRVTAKASDGLGIITDASYSVNDGPWQLAAPVDGLFDDTSESFTITLPAGLAAGVHVVSVRAADASANVGTASVTFTK